MADKIQLRRDTASNWSTQNPVLSQGELGAETDTLKIKMGDSTSTWNQLSYLIDTGSYATSAELTAAVSNLVDAAPGALDTLNELAAALGDDANFATTVTDAIALKATASTLSTVATTGAYADVTGTPTLSTVATTGAYADVTGTPALAAVATSGNYSSLTGRPSIPGVLTDLSITDGTVGQVLTTDGSGGFTFDDTSGGGSFEATASGTLANGAKVLVNSDGTVSVVGLVNAVADSASTVAVSNFHPTDVYGVNAHVHSYTNKVIITFGDYDNGNLTTVVVGEISGSSITFGTPVVFVNAQQMDTDIASMPGNKFALFHNDGTSRDATDIGQITIGTISGTSVTLGTPVNIPGTGNGYPKTITYEPSSDKLVIGTSDSSGRILLRTGTVSGNNVTFGSTVYLDSGSQSSVYRAYDPSTNQIIYAMERNGTVKLRLASVSGTSVTLGSANTIATSSSPVRPVNIEMVVDTNQNKVVMAFQNVNGWTRHISLGSISGTSITISPSTNVQISSALDAATLVFDSTLNKTVMLYRASAGLTGQVIDASGSNASFESAFLVEAGSSFEYSTETSFDATSGRIVSIYRNSNTGKAAIISSASATTNLTSENFVGIADASYSSGTTATIQTAGAVDDAQSGLTAGQAYFLQGDGTLNTTPDTPRVFAGVALSATELMIGKDMSSAAVVTYTDSDVATYLAGNGYDSASTIISTITDSAPATLDTLNELAAALGDDANFASTVTSSLALKANTSSLSTVATSGAYSDLTGTPAAVVPGGSFDAVASGTLANGDKVIVNTDGTVSVVEISNLPNTISSATTVSSNTTHYMDSAFDSTTNKVVTVYASSGQAIYAVVGTVSGSSISFGSPITVDSQGGYYPKVSFDSNSNKIVVTYDDKGNSYYGTAIVGTVSGNSISFGTPVVFTSERIRDNETLFDSTSNKIIVGYTKEIASSTDGFIQIGTVSGNSISFGTSVSLASGLGVWGMSMTHDTNSNKIVVSYSSDGSNSVTYSRVGTVSGNTISLGTAVAQNSTGNINNTESTFDSNSNKVVIVRQEHTNVRISVIIGTVSGNSISFGSPVQLPTSPGAAEPAFSQSKAIFFDPIENKIVLSYSDEKNSNKLTLIVGVVSGNTITFSTPLVMTTAGQPKALMFDSNSNKALFFYRDYDDSNKGKAVIVTSYSSTSTNLTSENFVGISDGSYASGATATIQTAGAVDDAQSGLTAGQAYFLQEDGTLNTTPATPRVFAGVALSATELMIGRDMSSAAVVTYTDSDVATYLTGNDYATQTATIAAITDSAPATLDTLNELAAALGDDANFASTVTSSLALKADTSSLSTVATSGAYSDLTGTPAAVVPGGSFDAVASGTLANGDKVVVNADGTVASVQPAFSSAALAHTLDNPNGYGTPDNDAFGSKTISVNGNYAIVGAPEEDDAGGENSGKAYIFNAASGALLHTLSNPNPGGAKQFGSAVSVSGNYAVVGASRDVGGKAYIYNVTSGALLHTLNNPNNPEGYNNDEFGTSVAISGNYAIIGAEGEHDANGNYSGIAYIFNVTSGVLSQTLANPNAYGTSADDGFGKCVAISGNYALVGAQNEDDAGGNQSGKAYIFNVTSGALLHTLDNPNAHGTSAADYFGTSLAIDGNNAIVGAWAETSDGLDRVGRLYVFNATTGALSRTIDNPNAYGTADSDDFGISVAISGNYAIVGARYEDDAGGASSGKSYIYNVTSGALLQTLANPNAYGTSLGDTFGHNVSIAGNYAIVAAPGEDSATHNSVGKVYIYDISVTPNLTTENFVGISDGAYASGATATIQTAGAVDDAQSGLTAGQAYFVQEDGTIATTADSTRVFAGVALSATELMIGRDMSASSVVTYTDSDVATYLSGNGYTTQTATIAAGYSDSDVSTYLSGNGYDTATNIISTITDSAPGTLDTLNELAAALGDDANFASTVTSSLTLKANTSSLATVATSGAYADVTGTPTLATVATSGAYADVTGTPTLATVATSGAYSDLTGTPAAVVPGGSFTATATGTLANGDKVVVNSDGTVSLAGSSIIDTSSQGSGSAITFESNGVMDIPDIVFLDSSRFVMVYTDANTSYVKVVVGTISGSSITFGSTVVVESLNAASKVRIEKVAANKIVMTYMTYTGGNVTKLSVGTISGTSISMGSAVTWPYATNGVALDVVSYDPTEDKILVVAPTVAGAYTNARSVAAGTISGNSITFGSQVEVSTHAEVGRYFKAVYDSTTNQTILSYQVSGGSKYQVISLSGSTPTAHGGISLASVGSAQFAPDMTLAGDKVVFAYVNDSIRKVVAGSISSGSLSLGTPVSYTESGLQSSDLTAISYDESMQKLILVAAGTDDSWATRKGVANLASLSGTAITIDSASFIVAAATSNQNEMPITPNILRYDSVSGKFVYVYQTLGFLNNGRGAIIRTVSAGTASSHPLTAENFVGIADGAYASGATATIQTVGSTDDAQSGLTAGQAYFVQADGTIATTADSTRVFAGVALSATELMIGRDLPADLPTGIVTADGNGDVTVAGEFIATSYNETYVALSGTTPTVDCETGNLFSLTTSGATTFTFSNPPATGTAYGMSVKLVAGGNHAITWPASVDWASATAPDAPASGETDMLSFITHDGGTTWYGFLAGDALA